MKKKTISILISITTFLSLLIAGYLGMRRDVSALEEKIQVLIPEGSEYRQVSG